MKVTYGAIVQGASGRFGGTVHSNWKGVQVVRRFAKPSNPDTTAQAQVRDSFKNLTVAFLLQPAGMRAAWDSFVTGKPLINRNAWLARNVPAIHTAGEEADLVPTPGDSSTLQPSAFVPTAGNDQITTVVTAPAIPTGWAISFAFAVAIPVYAAWNEPEMPVLSASFKEASDASSPYTGATITGLQAGDYNTWAFLQWLAPDGSARYSAALNGGVVTVT